MKKIKKVFFVLLILIAGIFFIVMDLQEGGAEIKKLLLKAGYALFIGFVCLIGKVLWDRFRPVSDEENEVIRRFGGRDNPFVENPDAGGGVSNEVSEMNTSSETNVASEMKTASEPVPWCRDILVFDLSQAPDFKSGFMIWYEEQVNWKDDWDYEDESNTTAALRGWFMELIKTYPPMNGKYSPSEEALEEDETLEDRMAEYSIGENVIYAVFSGSVCEEAYVLALSLAKKHGVGFFEAGIDDGDVILPNGSLMVNDAEENE